LKVTPLRAYSADSERINPSSPCLAAVYGAMYGAPTLLAIDAMEITAPFARRNMPGKAALVIKKGPVHSKRPLPDLILDVCEFVRGGNTGVVYQDVDATPCFLASSNRLLARCSIGHVEL
jgi:hypothetical protein